MNKSQKLLAAVTLLIAVTLAAAVSQRSSSAQAGGPNWHGFDRANLDTSTAACTDFYQYANGGWLAANPIPGAYNSWGVANVLNEKNRDVLHDILEAAAKNTSARKGSNEQKIGDYYATCMDEQKIEAEGLKQIQVELNNISMVRDQKSLEIEIGHLHSIGLNALFNSGSNRDFKNNAEVIVALFQGGISLPDPAYYKDEKLKLIRDEYIKHIAKMFELLGDDATKAAAEAQTVMTLETKLAAGSKTRVELRDPEKLYHRMPLEKVSEVAPHFDWPAYFVRAGLTKKSDVNVATPDFFKTMDALITSTPMEDWQTYLRWYVINSTAANLSAKFVDEDFRFNGTILSGQKENLPRWKRCVAATNAALGEAVGQIYVQKAFPPAAKERALAMVRNLQAALKEDLSTLGWMGDATRKQAISKLEGFASKIGYPDKWRDYSRAEVVRDSYVFNRVRLGRFNEERDMAKVGKPADKTEWGMTPSTVNAQYNPQNNDITFPAGILQPPFFDADAEDAFNYGGMGSVIGHEMTHGFDDQGARFNAAGDLANWWSEADLKEFKTRAKCIIDQFSAFEAEKGLHLNGELVVGESIADLGGLLIAYRAFEKSQEGKPKTVIDGFTPEQRFFLGYARGWATNIRPEQARRLVITDPHPLTKFRVNGPVSNLPQFAAAFQCKAGDPMVRPEKDRCQIW